MSGGRIISSYRLPDGRVPIVLSAESPNLLIREAVAVLGFLDEHPESGVDQIAGALLRTRTVRPHRALAMVSGREDLIRALRAVVSGATDPAVVSGDGPAAARRVGFVFPGHGNPRPGMGRLYYDESAAYRAQVDECAAILDEEFATSRSLQYLLADEDTDEIGVVHPALFAHTLGLAAMWFAAGVAPDATIGHSLGEPVAAAVCGLATVRDALVAAKVRADLLAEHTPRGFTMAVLGVGIDEGESLIARHPGWLKLSAVHSPNIVAISGDRTAAREIAESVRGSGRFAEEIRVDHPAHTDAMASYRGLAADGVRKRLYETVFDDPATPLFAATVGDRVPSGVPQAEYWFLNLRNRVRFDRAAAAAADSADLFVELTDDPMLTPAVRENVAATRTAAGDGAGTDTGFLVTSHRDRADLGEFTRNLATVAVGDRHFRWERFADGSARKPGPAVPHGFPGRAVPGDAVSGDAAAGWVVPPRSPGEA